MCVFLKPISIAMWSNPAGLGERVTDLSVVHPVIYAKDGDGLVQDR